MTRAITVSECEDYSGINSLLRDLYYEMEIDQTKGVVLQIYEGNDTHVIYASDGHLHGYALLIGNEIHALFPSSSRGAWALRAAKEMLAFIKKEYKLNKLVTGRYSCYRHAGIFMSALGFKLENISETEATAFGQNLKRLTYTLEI